MNGPASNRGFLVGGHFRDFFSRYPESWLMYAKMMNTHVLVNQVRGDKYKKKAAQNELWKGQSHHAYWNSATGGIYENELRKAVYRSLIEAEKITRATEIFAPSILSVDYDMDNRTEFLYQGSELNAYIHTLGGALFELDFLPASWNYLDTMVERDGGIARPTSARRSSTTSSTPVRALPRFQSGNLAESGDFLSCAYEMAELNRALPELLMRRDGTVTVDGVAHPSAGGKAFRVPPAVHRRVLQAHQPRSRRSHRHLRRGDQRVPGRALRGERAAVPPRRGPQEGDRLRCRRARRRTCR